MFRDSFFCTMIMSESASALSMQIEAVSFFSPAFKALVFPFFPHLPSPGFYCLPGPPDGDEGGLLGF